MQLSSFDNGVNAISRWCNWISCAAVLVMMLLVCANVILSLFDIPILGTYEYVTLTSAVVIAFGLAHTMVVKGHVAVDLVMRRFSRKVQAIVETITGILTLGIFAIVTWRLVQFGFHNYTMHLATETMDIPLYPFNFMIAFGFFLLLFVLVNNIIKSMAEVVTK
ncbi:MAG: TRAP transporter small permease subunit [Desulfopila sp.]